MPHVESRVAAVSREKGLPTVGALARATGLHHSTVQRPWEPEASSRIKFSTLTRLCHTLDATCDDLLTYIPDDA
jgi:DNA-binding Xre family transcriptional regulator